MTDLDKLLEDYDRRIFDVEQQMSSPTIMLSGGSEFPDGITIGDDVFFGPDPPEQVDTVNITVGAIYDNIYADVEWEPSATGAFAASFRVVWALGDGGAGGLIGNAVVSGTSYRIENLQPNTDYSLRVIPFSNTSAQGPETPWVDFTTVADTTVPPAPGGVVIGRGATTVVVKYTPLTAAEALDVANGNGIYEIEIDTANTFNTGNLRSMRSADQIVAFNDVIAEGNWYARVRAIDSSGNVSVWSATAGPALAGGVIDSMIVAGLDAAKITVGFLSASRLQANTVTADKLAAGEIASAVIKLTGSGYIWGGVSGQEAFVLAASGFYLYKDGVPTVSLNASTGDASFKGTVTASTITGSVISGTTISGGSITGTTFQTSATNQRIVLELQQYLNGSAYSSPRVLMYGAPDSAGAGPAEIQAEWTNNGTRGGFHFTGIDAWGYAPRITLDTFSNRGEIGIMADNIYMLGNQDGGGGWSGNCVVRLYGTLQVDTLTTYGSKQFRIPHPVKKDLDLIHCSLEGPENGVYYRGVAKTRNGKAVVKLPYYFEALRKDHDASVYVTPRGTLTTICASEVEDGTFTVLSGEDCEFSWLVVSVRGDIAPLEVEESHGDRLTLEWLQHAQVQKRDDLALGDNLEYSPTP